MPIFIQINDIDNVAVALHPAPAGTAFGGAAAVEEIPQGHKMALKDIAKGDMIMKYGLPIGHATKDIKAGQWVHTHNMMTNLKGEVEYTYDPAVPCVVPLKPKTFMGYRRKDGRAAIRNEIWIIPTVGCVNDVAKTLVRDNQDLVKGSIDGLFTFTHPFGCSQTGHDHAQTRRLLAALCRHPNAGAVLVLHLGCENLTHEQFVKELGDYDPERVKFLTCQQVEDELEAGSALLKELAEYASQFKREEMPVSELVVGMKCGGSDGLSGITANPTVGRFSDLMTAMGGTTILTEVPEMFGAENFLMSRCVNEGESCGCVQKGGRAPIMDVINYGEQVKTKGLNLLYGPGNDLVSCTALTAAGCNLILFTTGRGTPFGAPVPTMKIATNTPLATKKANWIDFNAGVVADGAKTLDEAGADLLDLVCEVASGKLTSTERKGFREISIFKDGVVL